MNILHFVNAYHPSIGGSQHLFKSISERLFSNYGDAVTIFTTNVVQQINDHKFLLIPAGFDSINGVNVRRFSFLRKGKKALKISSKIGRRLHLPFNDFFDLLYRGPISSKMFYETIHFKPDVMAVTPINNLTWIYPYMSKRFVKNVPLVFWGALHITNEYIGPSILRAISNVDAYIANTEYEKNILIKKGINKNRIHVLGVGVELKYFDLANGNKIRKMFSIEDKPLIAFIGRQSIGKGIDTLVNAMKLVWKEVPSACLLIAGAKSDFSEQLNKMIEELSCNEKNNLIIVNSFSEEIKPDLFDACDIFVNASRVESFGIVYIEAWACRKPVIGCRIGSVSSVISDGIDGLLIDYGDSLQLSNAILTLLKNKVLRKKLSQNGRHKVESLYNWEIITTKLRDVYMAVL